MISVFAFTARNRFIICVVLESCCEYVLLIYAEPSVKSGGWKIRLRWVDVL